MKTPIDFNGFIQVSLIVKDIEKAAREWCDLFDAPMPEIHIQKKGPGDGVIYRDKEADYEFKLASIAAKDRGFIIELHEAVRGGNTYQEFYDKHGVGVHHLGFEAGDKTEAIIGELKEKGYRMRSTGTYPGGSWAIVDSEDRLGVNLNIKPKR
ncbi:lactoylglutathione lyase [Spirochaetia bacterium]|nr:lactoylglutathione lyase [Spirochaetia bacterium]